MRKDPSSLAASPMMLRAPLDIPESQLYQCAAGVNEPSERAMSHSCPIMTSALLYDVHTLSPSAVHTLPFALCP